MKMNYQLLLDKYIPISLDSIKIEQNLLDFEKEIIFEEKSQTPSLVLCSSCPFDKNFCFYNIVLNETTKENIFPKEKYFLKSQQILEERPIDINSIFNDDKKLDNILQSSETHTNDNNDKNVNKNIEDEFSIQNKIISTIKNKHYKSYIPKNLNNEKNEDNVNSILPENNISSNEIENEWYIIGEKKEGPFNDTNMYNKLYQIYYQCFSKKEKLPNYIVNEKRSDIFMTMDECFDKLKKKIEYQKQKNNQQVSQAQKVMPLFMNNALFYQNQMLRYYQMNKMMMLNNANYYMNNSANLNNNLNNKKNSNKFDNFNQNNLTNNNRNNISNIGANNKTYQKNYKNNNYNNNYGNNKYNNRNYNKKKNNNNNNNNNYQKNFNNKGYSTKNKQYKEVSNTLNTKEENNNNNASEKNIETTKMTNVDVDEFFSEK